jgi:nucleoside-diphosphate-sugar epimerase
VVAETAARAKVQRVRVLVTGGAGFVASHVAGFCVNTLGYEVVVADDLSGGFVANVPDRATLVKVGSTASSAAPCPSTASSDRAVRPRRQGDRKAPAVANH